MEISPTSAVVSVGATTTLSVTYRDAKGVVVPETSFRLTYYGCLPVAPVTATSCNELISLLPVSPYLRQVELTGLAAGKVKIYASDGLGAYVWADVVIQ